MTPDQLIQQALRHHSAGELQQAEAIYRQVLTAHPEHPDALHLLGVLAHQVGRNEIAIELIGRAIRVRPLPMYYSNLGEAQRAAGNAAAAEASYRTAIRLDPSFIDAYNNLGSMLLDQYRPAEAAEVFRAGLAKRPEHASGWSNLGIALADQNLSVEAIRAFEKALQLDPRDARAHNNLSLALCNLGRFDQGIAGYERTIALKPDYAEAYNNMAMALQTIGRIPEAIAANRQALALNPDYAEAHSNLAMALQTIGRIPEAIAANRKALALNPGYAEAHSNLLLAMHYDDSQDAQSLFNEHLSWAKRHAGVIDAAPYANDRNPDRRLRIGYISPDFRTHSVAFFMEPLLAAHDRTEFEITCYSDTATPDGTTARIEKLADTWRLTASLSDIPLAELVRQDKIDILVDLTGHTANNRLFAFARKPAPVQVTYLGYPDTTGLTTIDYRITDALADPSSDALHTERLIRLPRTPWCYRPIDAALDVGPLLALNNGLITFGSFNTLAKLSPTTIDLWSSVLNAIPHSRLMIKAAGVGEASVQNRIYDAFTAKGVAAIQPITDRIILAGRDGSVADHLRAYQSVDIALDTFPYHGTTTTCDALWMGVPVITLAGATHVSRVGASLLNAVGLDDLVANTPQRFIEIASRLANDRSELATLRAGMRERLRKSPLMDAASLARAIEAGYRAMWQKWCADVDEKSA